MSDVWNLANDTTSRQTSNRPPADQSYYNRNSSVISRTNERVVANFLADLLRGSWRRCQQVREEVTRNWSHWHSDTEEYQNASGTRLDCSAGKCDHITPLLHDLNWLRVPQRIEFKLAVLAFHCLHGTIPCTRTAPCGRHGLATARAEHSTNASCHRR